MSDQAMKEYIRELDARVVAKGGWSIFDLKLPSSFVPATSRFPGRPGPYPAFSKLPVADARFNGQRRPK